MARAGRDQEQSAQKVIPSITLVDEIRRVLTESILSGDQEPGGKLSISGLAVKHGVSLSVMREAMTRLVADGLATSHAMRGFRVVEISQRDLEDLGEVRLLILSEAIRQSIANADAAWETRVMSANPIPQLNATEIEPTVDTVRQLSLSAFRFESALISAAKNQRLIAMYETTFQALQLYHRLSVRLMLDQRDELRAECALILAHALARDAEGVIDLFRQQYNRIHGRIIDHLQHKPTRRAA